MDVSMGRLSEEHQCGIEDGEEIDDCDCDEMPFSWAPCDGCGSALGGRRHAYTFWCTT
jgi:hypothetical protein